MVSMSEAAGRAALMAVGIAESVLQVNVGSPVAALPPTGTGVALPG